MSDGPPGSCYLLPGGTGCGFFGNLANSEGNCVWGVQLKYEF